jgi:Fe2+ or Zn2+ uptake regulation protein
MHSWNSLQMLRTQNRKSALVVDFQADQYTSQLHGMKLRATFPRAMVLAMLLELGEHDEVTPQDLYLKIEAAYGNVVPMVACYRILGDFEKAGFLQHRYQVRDGRASVIYRRIQEKPRGEYVRFSCTNCLSKVAVTDERMLTQILAAASNAGFHLADGWTIAGLCNKCHFPT